MGKDTMEEKVDLGLRRFIKQLGYAAGGTAFLAGMAPWLTSCTPEKIEAKESNVINELKR